MTKVKFLYFWLFIALGIVTVAFNSCGNASEQKENALKQEESLNNSDNPSNDEGVIINGVKWATRNVAAPGTFAAKPEDSGMFYQWNRKKAWPTTGDVTGWNEGFYKTPIGTTWEKSNDPSPAGWRVPTIEELQKLLDTNKVSRVRTTQNGIDGRIFTDKATGKDIFLPTVAGGRRGYNHMFVTTFVSVGSGIYWSSTRQGDGTGFMIVPTNKLLNCAIGMGDHNEGHSIRPVAD